MSSLEDTWRSIRATLYPHVIPMHQEIPIFAQNPWPHEQDNSADRTFMNNYRNNYLRDVMQYGDALGLNNIEFPTPYLPGVNEAARNLINSTGMSLEEFTALQQASAMAAMQSRRAYSDARRDRRDEGKELSSGFRESNVKDMLRLRQKMAEDQAAGLTKDYSRDLAKLGISMSQLPSMESLQQQVAAFESQKEGLRDNSTLPERIKGLPEFLPIQEQIKALKSALQTVSDEYYSDYDRRMQAQIQLREAINEQNNAEFGWGDIFKTVLAAAGTAVTGGILGPALGSAALGNALAAGSINYWMNGDPSQALTAAATSGLGSAALDGLGSIVGSGSGGFGDSVSSAFDLGTVGELSPTIAEAAFNSGGGIGGEITRNLAGISLNNIVYPTLAGAVAGFQGNQVRDSAYSSLAQRLNNTLPELQAQRPQAAVPPAGAGFGGVATGAPTPSQPPSSGAGGSAPPPTGGGGTGAPQPFGALSPMAALSNVGVSFLEPIRDRTSGGVSYNSAPFSSSLGSLRRGVFDTARVI